MSAHPERPAPRRSGPKRLSSSILLVLATLPLWGCASDYVARTRQVRSAYQSYQYEDALKDVELSPDARDTIDRAYSSVRRGHDEMSRLKHGLEAR